MKAQDLMTHEVCTVSVRSRPPMVLPHKRSESEGTRLFVVENGAHCAFLPLLPAKTDETVVIQEGEGEFPIHALSRVNYCIAELERSGRRPGRAILVVAPELEVRRMAARRLIARALRAAASSLAIVLDSRADLALRHEMLAVVEELVSESECSEVPILLRFGQSGEPRALELQGGISL